MSSVQLSNLHKTYPNGHHAVKGIDLSIHDGEFLVLVGPSGCGKSTVLRMIAGLEDISSGEIAIDGRVVNDLSPSDRDIAMVFQSYALYPHMTVRDNMAMALRLRGLPREDVDRRVLDAAKMLAIDSMLDRKPGQLSGGQRQRVAVGRAIVREPKVALFDEPLSNLDAKLRVATRGELKQLHTRLRTTSVYVTHDQEEAMTLGDRIVVMHDGVIQQCDTPMNVYQRPANRFVAAFIGMPPMNFFDGILEARPEGLGFAFGDGLRLPVHASHVGSLQPHVGKAVTLGLRPQAFALATGQPSVQVTAVMTEPLGDLMDMTCQLGPMRVIARLSWATPPTPGSPCSLSVRTSEAHWFEAGSTGSRLA